MPRGNNPSYWITVINESQGIEIIADMPEQFAFTTSSQFDFSSGMALGSIPNISDPTGITNITVGGNTIATAVGGDVLLKSLTKRIWKGTSPIEFTLHLTFDAETNSKQDVHDKLILLQTMPLPGLGFTLPGAGDVLLPPNPTRFSSNTNRVEIRIGRQYRWDNMVVVSAAMAEEQRLNEGFPIAGQIDLTITSDYVYDKQDLMKAAGLRIPRGFEPSAAAISDGMNALRAIRGAQGDE